MLRPILTSDVYLQGEIQEGLSNITDTRLSLALHQRVNRLLDLAIGDQTNDELAMVIWETMMFGG